MKGPAILMAASDFKQNMSHQDTLNLGTTLNNVWGDIDPRVLNKIKNDPFTGYNNLPKRPDYDGILTADEAPKWYHSAGGRPVFVDRSKMNLYPINISDFTSDKRIFHNYFWDIGEADSDMRYVYGSVMLTLNPNGSVLVGDSDRIDNYDFSPDGNVIYALGNMYANWITKGGTSFVIMVMVIILKLDLISLVNNKIMNKLFFLFFFIAILFTSCDDKLGVCFFKTLLETKDIELERYCSNNYLLLTGNDGRRIEMYHLSEKTYSEFIHKFKKRIIDIPHKNIYSKMDSILTWRQTPITSSDSLIINYQNGIAVNYKGCVSLNQVLQLLKFKGNYYAAYYFKNATRVDGIDQWFILDGRTRNLYVLCIYI